MRARYLIVGGMAFLILAAGFDVASAGVRVPLEKVPAPAVKGIKSRFPKAEIDYVDKETNGNYEFAMKEGKRQFDVGITPAGKLVNVKEEIAEEKLPAKVKESVQKKYPGAEFIEIEKVISGEGKSAKTTFEMDLRDKGKKVAVIVDDTGKLLK